MPIIRVHGTDLYYEEHGQGRETVVLAHGLFFSGRMFDEQVAALKDRYRCVTFDFRGQGQSEITRSGYDLDTLTEDAVALIREHGYGPCHFVGLSMGGMVGMRLAVRHPELLRSLTLASTTAEGEPNVWRMRALVWLGPVLGLRTIVSPILAVLFGQPFLGDQERARLRDFWREQIAATNALAISRTAFRLLWRRSFVEEVGRIAVPTLILVGENDIATPADHSRQLHERIPGSRLRIIPRAGHSPPIEEPQLFTAALREFLDGLVVLTIEPADVRSEEAQRLIARLSEELAQRYNDGDDGAANFKAEDVLGPRSGFLVARLNGVAVGCGAFRLLEESVAEIKRMYVEPTARGRGIARRLLKELEARARQAGFTTVRLETGTAQPEAIRLYEVTGYRRIPNYGYYKDHPLSVCFEKSLSAPR